MAEGQPWGLPRRSLAIKAFPKGDILRMVLLTQNQAKMGERVLYTGQKPSMRQEVIPVFIGK